MDIASISQPLLDDFVSTFTPSQIMQFEQLFPALEVGSERGVVSIPHSMLSTCNDSIHCLSGSVLNSSLVIDSSASVCIFPHQGDFINYGKSNMKIKDLSASNNVAGEGIIRWKLKDTSNSSVMVEVKGYHMPHASVRLLSPQVLLQTIGGQSLQTTKGISLTLNNGVKLFATYCPQNNLPLLPLARPDDNDRCFWSHAFGFNANEFHKINSVRSSLLHNNNTNLSQSQKEVLLWHQRLSHASVQ